jgi:hypothetical protein
MTTPEGNLTSPTVPSAAAETIVVPPPEDPGDTNVTIDLRDTVLVPAQPLEALTVRSPAEPASLQSQPVERLRFGPGVPAVIAAAPVAAAEASASSASSASPRKLRRGRALNLALTLALAAVVIWLLWPAGALRVHKVSVQAKPDVVACQKSADVVATVLTNGNAGQLRYRWTRNDGIGSATLVQSVARGQHSVGLHLRWAFSGPGTYNAIATVHLLSPGTQTASVNFSYQC